MASLMNLALVASQLGTKYLNLFFTVQRGEYGELGILMIVASVLAFLLPIMAIVLFGWRIEVPGRPRVSSLEHDSG